VVATITPFNLRARRARSTTRTSIGSPPMSSKTLPGRREEPMRAWMMAMVRGRLGLN
jgi:hypothetical protein